MSRFVLGESTLGKSYFYFTRDALGLHTRCFILKRELFYVSIEFEDFYTTF